MTPSNANTSGLAPCPFCGGEAWLNDYEAKYSDLPPKSRCPQCRSCGVSLGYLATPAKATEAWNRRVTAASAQARIAELERALEKTASDFREAAEAHDAEKARADRLAKALDTLQDLFAREGECSMERFERLAEMFRKDTGYLAPGKDPGMLSQQPEGEELRRIYDDWFAAKIVSARAALQQEG